MAFPAPDVATLSVLTCFTAPKNPIAELKNGRIVFKQKPVSFEKASETMQEIVKFREMLESRVQSQDLPLGSIPEEHKPLIVKLAQESDKGIVPLARQIRSILLPGPGEVEDAHRLSLESNLPLGVVEHAIKMIMTRINYGLDGLPGQKLPAAVCAWRWEVQDAYRDWLPKSARDSADARLAERIQASADLRAAFGRLPQAEQDAILDPKGTLKHPVSDINKSETSAVSTTTIEHIPEGHAPMDVPSGIANSEALSESLAQKGRTKKPLDPEKVAKIKDKEEKRAAKAEKEKKQKEAQDRSRSIMVNFFGKPKPSAQDLPTKDLNATVSLPVDNEFQRTFKPFALKKDAEIAPHNWFLEGKKHHKQATGVSHEEAIVIDGDAPVDEDPAPGMLPSEVMFSAASSDLTGTLREFIKVLHRSNLSIYRRRRKIPSLKTYNPHSVRDVISQLNDAEIAGDPTQVRYLLSVLRDRQIFPAKVLIFHEDSRPGYYGTWTHNSREVGPRTPLGRDVLTRDYGYDSGEDWEDEGPGDADDVVDDGEDDEPDAEDADSDLDSWLDDGDEIQPLLDLDDPLYPPLDLSIPPSKRKAENMEKRSDKKRKVVVPLVPYVKGPFWESYLGHCEYDPFHPYRIQLLDDTPYPIDPFTFVSTVPEEGSSSQADAPPAIPTLSGKVQPPDVTVPKRTTNSAPRTVFPDAHLDTLLAKIIDLATPNFTFLIESIYQELRIHKIKKNAIEAKVREIGEKSKDKKIWVVKQAVQDSHLLS